MTWPVRLIFSTVFLCRTRKPKWLTLRWPLSSVCFWNIYRKNLWNSLIRCKFWGKFGPSLSSGKVINYDSFKVLLIRTAEGSVWIHMSVVLIMFMEDARDIHLEYHQVHKPYKMSTNFTDLCISQGSNFSIGVLSTDASKDWPVVSNRHSWFSSHKSWDVNWIPK